MARLSLAAALATALSITSALAETPAPVVTIVSCPPDNAAPHEAADSALVDNVFNAFSQASFPAVRIYLPRLREAMERAPACYPQLERRGGSILIRVADESEYAIVAAAAASVAAQTGERVSIYEAPNTYARVSLILASYANETRDFEAAVGWLDRGLALQPRNQFLTMEKASALIALRRYADAYALLNGALTDPEMALTLDRARFLRNAGIVLIDLNRLDEAETALNESIRIQPNNPVARQELVYIEELRRGGAQREGGIYAPNAPTPQTQ